MLFALHFDGEHVWCCNRSLSSMTYEGCTITGVARPLRIYGDAAEPLTLTIKDSTIRVREEYEKATFIDAINFERILLKNVSVEGYENPTVICRSRGTIDAVDIMPLTIIHSDEPAHFERE